MNHRDLRRVFATLAALALFGCADGNYTGPTAVSDPLLTVADAAGGWNPAFYWLPPIVTPFAPAGVFDPNRTPVVRICEWNANSCARQVAEFSIASGTGGETVTMDPVAEHYQVKWRTGDPAFQPLLVGSVYRIAVFLDSREAGFADVYLVGTKREEHEFQSPGYIPVASGSNFKIKFRIETQIELLDLYFDRKGDGSLGQAPAGTYSLTMTNDPSGTFEAVYTDGITAGVFSGERRFARSNPVVRAVYSDVDFFAVWAGRQNSDNSVDGAWLDAAGQTGDFWLVEQGQPVTRSDDAGTRLIPSTYKAANAAELDGEWILDFDRTYDGVYVPEAGGTNTLALTANNSSELSAVYADGSSGAYAGALYTARHTSVITLLFSDTDYYAAFAGAMTGPNNIVGVYFDAEGHSGDFVLTRNGTWERTTDHPTSGGPYWYSIGLAVAEGYLVTVAGTHGPCQTTDRTFTAPIASSGEIGEWTEQARYVRTSNFDAKQVVAFGSNVVGVGGWDCGWYHNSVGVATIGSQGSIPTWTASTFPRLQTGHATVVSGDYLYAIGGVDVNCPGTVVRNVTYSTVSSAGELAPWLETTPLPEGRRFPGAIAMADGRIFVLGGNDDGCDEFTNTIWMAQRGADGSLSAWTAAGTLPRAGDFYFGGAFLTDEGGVLIGLGDESLGITQFYQGSIVGNTLGDWVDAGSGPDDRLSYTYSGGYVYGLGGDSPAVYRRRVR